MEKILSVQPSESAGDVCVVDLTGELDLFVAPDLKAKLVSLISDGRDLLVLDFRKVEYIDSTCLGSLVAALKRANERGGAISLACPNPQIRRVFEITGLARLFSVHESVDAARAALATRSTAAR